MLNPGRLAILALVLSGASLASAYRNRPETTSAALRADVDVLLAGEASTPEAARARLKETLKSVRTEIFAERLHERQIQRSKSIASAFERFAGEARARWRAGADPIADGDAAG